MGTQKNCKFKLCISLVHVSCAVHRQNIMKQINADLATRLVRGKLHLSDKRMSCFC